MLQFYLFSLILEHMRNFFVSWNKLFSILREYFLFLKFVCYAQHNRQIHPPLLRLICIINIFSICFLGPDIAHRKRTTNLLPVRTSECCSVVLTKTQRQRHSPCLEGAHCQVRKTDSEMIPTAMGRVTLEGQQLSEGPRKEPLSCLALYYFKCLNVI